MALDGRHRVGAAAADERAEQRRIVPAREAHPDQVPVRPDDDAALAIGEQRVVAQHHRGGGRIQSAPLCPGGPLRALAGGVRGPGHGSGHAKWLQRLLALRADGQIAGTARREPGGAIPPSGSSTPSKSEAGRRARGHGSTRCGGGSVRTVVGATTTEPPAAGGGLTDDGDHGLVVELGVVRPFRMVDPHLGTR